MLYYLLNRYRKQYHTSNKSCIDSSVTIPFLVLYLTRYSLLVKGCTNRSNIQEFYILPHCIYVFCIYLRTNNDFCPT